MRTCWPSGQGFCPFLLAGKNATVVPSGDLMSIPAQCHLWQAEELTAKDLYGALTVVETFLDEPHQTRDLRKCNFCGQLYFHEYLDWIDWEKGEIGRAQV